MTKTDIRDVRILHTKPDAGAVSIAPKKKGVGKQNGSRVNGIFWSRETLQRVAFTQRLKREIVKQRSPSGVKKKNQNKTRSLPGSRDSVNIAVTWPICYQTHRELVDRLRSGEKRTTQ